MEPPDLSNNQLCYNEQKGKRELSSKYLLRKLRWKEPHWGRGNLQIASSVAEGRSESFQFPLLCGGQGQFYHHTGDRILPGLAHKWVREHQVCRHFSETFYIPACLPTCMGCMEKWLQKAKYASLSLGVSPCPDITYIIFRREIIISSFVRWDEMKIYHWETLHFCTGESLEN